jgi:hypothetical protein
MELAVTCQHVLSGPGLDRTIAISAESRTFRAKRWYRLSIAQVRGCSLCVAKESMKRLESDGSGYVVLCFAGGFVPLGAAFCRIGF